VQKTHPAPDFAENADKLFKGEVFMQLNQKLRHLDSKGMIAVEALTSFIFFMLCTAFLVAWINLSTVQLRVHNALTQTAQEVAFYAHALQIVGVPGAVRYIRGLSEDPTESIDSVLDNAFGIVDAFSDGAAGASDLDLPAVKDAWNSGTEQLSEAKDTMRGWMDDPGDFLRGIIWVGTDLGVSAGLNYLLAGVVAPLFFERYMGIHERQDDNSFIRIRDYRGNLASLNVYMSGDDSPVAFGWYAEGGVIQQLRDSGLAGVRPSGAEFLGGDNADEITLAVKYYADFRPFFILPQSMRKVPIVQQVQTRAWVGDLGRFDSKIGSGQTSRGGP